MNSLTTECFKVAVHHWTRMKYITETNEDTKKEDGLQEKEMNKKKKKIVDIAKALWRVFMQLLFRGFFVFIFYWIFLFVVRWLKGSVEQYEESGKCLIGEK